MAITVENALPVCFKWWRRLEPLLTDGLLKDLEARSAVSHIQLLFILCRLTEMKQYVKSGVLHFSSLGRETLLYLNHMSIWSNLNFSLLSKSIFYDGAFLGIINITHIINLKIQRFYQRNQTEKFFMSTLVNVPTNFWQFKYFILKQHLIAFERL